MPCNQIKCPICTTKIPHPSIRSDTERSFPLAGEPREGQNVVACLCCGQLLHTGCVRDASTLVSWKHLWFSNPGMRALIEERRLFGLDVAFCPRCRDDLLEQILGNYRALQRFDEGARFRGDLGMYDEAETFLAAIRG